MRPYRKRSILETLQSITVLLSRKKQHTSRVKITIESSSSSLLFLPKYGGYLHTALATIFVHFRVSMNPHLLTVEEDLDDAARQVKADMRQKLEEMLTPEDLQKYAISAEADNELSKVGKLPKSGFVSVKGLSTTPPANKKDPSTPDGKSSKRKNRKEHGRPNFKKAKK